MINQPKIDLYNIKVKLEKTLQIEQFLPLLSRYSSWDATVLRDIRLTCLLGQKVLYEVEDISPNFNIPKKYLNGNKTESVIQVRVSKFAFIINQDLTVAELNLDYTCDVSLEGDEVNLFIHDNKVYGLNIETKREKDKPSL